ncbi:multicopper oxidase family protein [Bacillus salipaludis]|uniref:Multicopper oxidase n=1 Tax=Bacillus salipaludis TaxID=2547811 RepID=A0A4V3AU58_9BACI|nr:multicopper oxidase [Bacillus salipaludis]MDQ6597354.1 multicopper oxidase [Bacillus salipaludis]TDK63213.1 multicopper oxidase family protein [Bacillus salipaludis]
MKLTKFIDPLPIPPVLKPKWKSADYTYYEVKMEEVKQSLHSQIPHTPIWGYEGLYPGPTFEVETGERVFVKWMNNLPEKHLFPIDHTVHGAEKVKPDVRTVVHLHGGRTEPESDGYPDAWFTKGFEKKGPFFTKKIYEYGNLQSARALWYHDHAIGITRLNIYAGLAGFYLIRDPRERSLNLPSGKFEIPLLLQDRSFYEDGSLFYPEQSSEHPTEFTPSIISSFFGDTIVVNGKVWPFLEVEPRKYRLRLLNGANARFFHLFLNSGQPFFQIGTDSGLLERPNRVQSLLLAPAERADVIVDFSKLNGKSILMKNDARTHFPIGDPVDPGTTGTVMQFRVTKPLSSMDTSVIPPFMETIHRLPESTAHKQRFLQLSEEKDQFGRSLFLLDQKKWDDPISENPQVGTNEIWCFVNTNGDDHPIHVHLVQFQILDRLPFDVKHYKNTRRIRYTGLPVAPDSGERGWKDTVKCPPGHITRIIIPFFPFTGRYVWHCHMLEHEDYEMMRPYWILPPY